MYDNFPFFIDSDLQIFPHFNISEMEDTSYTSWDLRLVVGGTLYPPWWNLPLISVFLDLKLLVLQRRPSQPLVQGGAGGAKGWLPAVC